MTQSTKYRKEKTVMNKPVVVSQGEGEVLRVLGSEVRFLCRGDQTGQAWSVAECAAPRDVGPPPHHHAWDESYYVLEGQVLFMLEGRGHLVKTGDFIYVPAGTSHGFTGASDGIARVLIFDAPAHAEGFFRETEREVREMPRDLPKVPEIGARHGIHFERP
jgi:quercetin dioxygenase-like cupin family protein